MADTAPETKHRDPATPPGGATAVLVLGGGESGSSESGNEPDSNIIWGSNRTT